MVLCSSPRPRFVSLVFDPSKESIALQLTRHIPPWLSNNMVLGEMSGIGDGGRYGAVGESSGASASGGEGLAPGMEGASAMTASNNGMSNSSTSSSRSSVLVDDQDECGFMSHDVYQRQPLLHDKDLYVHNYNERNYKENSGNYYNGNASNGMVKIPIPSPLREEPRFPKERMKTLIAFVFLFSNWVLTTVALALTHERVPNAPPLPDITLDSINSHSWGLEASEIMIIISVYFCIIVVIFHKYRFIIFRRIFLILGLLYFYRSITMYVTVLPVADPDYYCSPKSNTTNAVLVLKRMVRLLSGFGLSMNGQHTFCGDYIYSGHTVCLVMAYLVVREYTPKRWWPLHWLFALFAALGIVMVLIARGHYTVDCIIAYYITTRIFYIYHTLAYNQNLKENAASNFFERLWWYPLFQYFERNVQGVVPRHYEWPFPWPRRWGSKNPQRTS